jgi:hypothetical protein
LEATPEPALRWLGKPTVQVSKAVDDRDQKLAAVRDAAVAAVNRPLAVRAGTATLGSTVLVPVRLRKGEQEARSLKEVSGTLTASIQSPPLEVVVVKDPLKAQGRTFAGEFKGSIKVLKAANDGGALRLVIDVTPPEKVVPDHNPHKLVTRTVLPFSKDAGPLFTGPVNGLALISDNGVVLACHLKLQRGSTSEFEIVCPPDREAGAPARLVFLARKAATVDIPFTLKDVPLR